MIIQDFFHSLYFFSLKDVLEVFFFAGIIYYISLLLLNDTKKNLLLSFYGYLLLIIITAICNLPSAHFLLLSILPILGCGFILFHQDCIQKNFISLHKIQLHKNIRTSEWPEIFIQSALYLMNRSQNIQGFIEKNIPLDQWFHNSYQLHNPIKKELLSYICSHHNFDETKYLYLDKNGFMKDFNGEFKERHNAFFKHIKSFEEYALLYSSKTDALFFKTNWQTKTFTFIAQGKQIESISAPLALSILQSYFLNKPTKTMKGDFNHAFVEKESFKQPHH